MQPSRFLFALALAVSASMYAANQFGPWSAPVPLEISVCNHAYAEITPAISKDGRSFYFASNCLPSNGFDLYVAQWDDQAAAWSSPQNLFMLNTTANDQGPALSRDGHYLYFASNRTGGKGGLDIWVSYREQTHDDFAWQAPVPVSTINSSVNDGGPALFQGEAGHQHMIFQSQRSGGAGLADFYATDQNEDGTWTSPLRVSELSSAAQEQRAAIRFDGLEVIIESNRAGTADLWVSTRETTTGNWSQPAPLPFNTPAYDGMSYLSGDGTALYFYSNRGGVPKFWVTKREHGKAH